MVDYSKWDRLAADLSDEEDIESSFTTTTLAQPGKVTIGPHGYSINPQQPSSSSSPATAPSSSSAIISEPTAAMKQSKEWQAICLNGGEVRRDSYRYLWSQDRYSVTLSLFVQANLLGPEVQILLVGEEKNVLKVLKRSDQLVLLDGRLQYPIEPTGEADNPYDSVCDWEFKPIPWSSNSTVADEKLLQITLKKKSPLPNTTIWWRKVFIEEEEEIDINNLVGRREFDHKGFAEVYEEAHRLFREKIAKNQPIEVVEEE
eukprot:gene2478-2715_t